MPGGAVEVIPDQVNRFTRSRTARLVSAFLIGLVISLWSANGGIKALFDALNVVYEEKEKRSFIKLNAVGLLFTFGVIFFILVALAGVIAIPIALNYLPRLIGLIIDIARWPV